MASLPDSFYLTIKDFQEINHVIKKEIDNFKNSTVNIGTTTMTLEKRIKEFKGKINNYKEAYLTRKPSVYNSSTTHKEKTIRLNKLEAFITQCNTYLKEVKQINASKSRYHKQQTEYFETREVQALSKANALLFQQRKLNNQDELIEQMIGVATENNQIGKEMKNVMSNQIVQIVKIDKDLETANNRVKGTNKRFENYIELASYCKLYAIIVVLLSIIIILLLF